MIGSSRGTVLSSGVSCNTFLPTSWLMTAAGSCAAAGGGGVRVAVLRASTLRHDMQHVGVLLPLSKSGKQTEGAGMAARAGRSPGAASGSCAEWVATAVLHDPAQPCALPSQAPPKILHLHECDLLVAAQATGCVLRRCRGPTANITTICTCVAPPTLIIR